MKVVMWIAAGGAAGASTRYFISVWVNQLLGKGFPWGTLVVNVLGSFLAGFVFHLSTERLNLPPELRTAILVGFFGALTTFSTFSVETLNLIEGRASLLAVVNIFANLTLCIVAVWLGGWLARQIY